MSKNTEAFLVFKWRQKLVLLSIPPKKYLTKPLFSLKDDDESEDDEKENSLPETQNFGRGGRRSAVIDHKLRTGRI